MLVQDDFFTSSELALGDLNPFVTCNISEQVDDDGNATGKVFAILTVQEDFAFHRDLDNSIFEDQADRMFSEDGQPTEAVLKALQSLVETRYGGEDFQTDDTGAEYFQFDIVLTVDPEMDAEDLGGKFWEETELVRFHNEADPGTFGSQYLFGSLIGDEIRKTED